MNVWVNHGTFGVWCLLWRFWSLQKFQECHGPDLPGDPSGKTQGDRIRIHIHSTQTSRTFTQPINSVFIFGLFQAKC